jgi:hypothetical protein
MSGNHVTAEAPLGGVEACGEDRRIAFAVPQGVTVE